MEISGVKIIERDGKKVAVIENLTEFVLAGLDSGRLVASKCKKVMPVRFVGETGDYAKEYGEKLEVTFALPNGPYVETVETVEDNPKKFIAEGLKYQERWPVGKNAYDEILDVSEIDELDVSDDVKIALKKLFEQGKKLYKPKPDERYAMQIEIEGVDEFEFPDPWGTKQNIRNGGYAIISTTNGIYEDKVDIYGNQRFTFESSYNDGEVGEEINQEATEFISETYRQVVEMQRNKNKTEIEMWAELVLADQYGRRPTWSEIDEKVNENRSRLKNKRDEKGLNIRDKVLEDKTLSDIKLEAAVRYMESDSRKSGPSSFNYESARKQLDRKYGEDKVNAMIKKIQDEKNAKKENLNQEEPTR